MSFSSPSRQSIRPTQSAPFKFRFLSLQEALSFGFGVFFSHPFLWGSVGLLTGVLHHLLLGLLAPDGTRLTLAERLLEALFLSVWPLAVAAETSSQAQDGGKPSLGDLLKVRNLFAVTFSMVCLFLIALGGAMLLVQAFIWFFPGVTEPLSRTLMGPVSVSSGWALLPLLTMGALFFGLPYSFGPFVALNEGKSFTESLERSRFLSRNLSIGIMFLHGFLFLILCGAFYLSNKLSNAPTLASRVAETLVIAGAASLAGAVWNNAYRQAIALDKEPVVRSALPRGRITIPDNPFPAGGEEYGPP